MCWRISLAQLCIRPAPIRSLVIVSDVTDDDVTDDGAPFLPVSPLLLLLLLLQLSPHGWCRIWCLSSESETLKSLTGGHARSEFTVPIHPHRHGGLISHNSTCFDLLWTCRTTCCTKSCTTNPQIDTTHRRGSCWRWYFTSDVLRSGSILCHHFFANFLANVFEK